MQRQIEQALLLGGLSFLALKAEISSPVHSFNAFGLKNRALRTEFPNSVVRKQSYMLNKDNLYIYWREWKPETDCKAVIILVHGLNEHSARYEHIAKRFTQVGVRVYALDHQGHGLSEGDRLFVNKLQDYIDDVAMIIQKAKLDNPSKKLFLLGHSMGGLIAIKTTLQYQDLIAGAIYSAPPLYLDPKEYSPTLISMLNLVATWFPKLRLKGLDLATLCQDKCVVDKYMNDPLVSTQFPTVNLQNEINKGLKAANDNCSNLKLPILILHGTSDRLCSIIGTKRLYEKVSSNNKVFKEYKGHFHEIMNEETTAIQDCVSFVLSLV